MDGHTSDISEIEIDQADAASEEETGETAKRPRSLSAGRICDATF